MAILEPALEEREESDEEVARQEKLVQSLRVGKDEALAEVNVAARSVVDIAAGYCKLVGRPGLAKKIRRFARRKLRPGPKKQRKRDESQAADAAFAAGEPGGRREEPESPPQSSTATASEA